MERLFAPGLKQGDTLGIVAPAGVVNRQKLQRAMRGLEQLGFRTKTYRDPFAQRGYLAGGDQQRADELMRAFLDPECQAIFPARGGYGCLRLVDLLDYAAIRAHPKVFVGFSDNTVLHAAFAKTTGLVSFHGPHPSDSYGAEEGATSLTAAALWRALLIEEYQRENQVGYQIDLPAAATANLQMRSPGVARGRLVGGNLALVCALLGTPYEIETAGNVLLLEDIGEPPYRVDRFLAQLKMAGHLDQLAGLLLGQFSDCQPTGNGPSLSLEEVFDDYLATSAYPVLANFPSGHRPDNVTLPLNVEVELNSDHKTLKVLENPVRLD